MAGCLGGRDHDGRFLCDRQVGARLISWERDGGLSLWCCQLLSYPAPLGLLFVADFTFRRRVHTGLCKPWRHADQTGQLCREDRTKRDRKATALTIPAWLDPSLMADCGFGSPYHRPPNGSASEIRSTPR